MQYLKLVGVIFFFFCTSANFRRIGHVFPSVLLIKNNYFLMNNLGNIVYHLPMSLFYKSENPFHNNETVLHKNET